MLVRIYCGHLMVRSHWQLQSHMMSFVPPPHVDDCSCSDSRRSELRKLCIGTAVAPCDCDERTRCEVSASKLQGEC